MEVEVGEKVHDLRWVADFEIEQRRRGGAPCCSLELWRKVEGDEEWCSLGLFGYIRLMRLV